jgi:branched-chain amino acid transport system substrate-binding protein
MPRQNANKLASLLALAGLMTGVSAPAYAATGDVVIGVLNDQSSIYAALHGPGSVLAAHMAVEDFGGKVNGHDVKIIFADHQNKPDVAVAVARQWLDEQGVDVIVDVPNSAVALAVADIVKQKNKVLLDSGGNTNRLTGDACTPNTVHWTLDNWADINGTIAAVAAHGGKTWFFLSVDAETGYDMERQSQPMLDRAGARMVGAVRYPLGTSDYSSFLLQAQSSKADVIAIAGGGVDVDNIVKQAREYRIQTNGQVFAGLAAYEPNVKGIGLDAAQGMILTVPFYWNLNDDTRRFAARFAERFNGRMPTAYQAGVYTGLLHYLKAAAKVADPADGRSVVAEMKALPTDDPLFGKGMVRVDGRAIHPMYVLVAKTPAESQGEWDLMKLLQVIPADQAFKPLDPACPLVAAAQHG